MEFEMDVSRIELTNDGIRFAATYEGRSFPVLIPRRVVPDLLNLPPECICQSREAREIIEQNEDRVQAAIREAYRKNLVDQTDKRTPVVMRDCF
jgi:stringent starvation protein B